MNRLVTLPLALAVSVFAFSETASAQVTGVQIGTYDHSTGSATIYENMLVKQFKTGGAISAFDLVSLGGNYYLERYGVDAGGVCKTDLVPVFLSGGSGGGGSGSGLSVITFRESTDLITAMTCRSYENRCRPFPRYQFCSTRSGDCACHSRLLDGTTVISDAGCFSEIEADFFLWQHVLLPVYIP